MDNTTELLNQYGGLTQNSLLDQIEGTENEDNEPSLIQPSRYIDLSNIDGFIINNKNSFTVLSLNAQSISAFQTFSLVYAFTLTKFTYHILFMFIQWYFLSNTTPTH